MTIEQVARVVHEIQKSFCESLGDMTLPAWENVPEEMKATVLQGVIDLLSNPDAGAGFSHERWAAKKRADGWVYGVVKSWEDKTHPMLIPFGDLPFEEVQKDVLLVQTVRSLQSFIKNETHEKE